MTVHYIRPRTTSDASRRPRPGWPAGWPAPDRRRQHRPVPDKRGRGRRYVLVVHGRRPALPIAAAVLLLMLVTVRCHGDGADRTALRAAANPSAATSAPARLEAGRWVALQPDLASRLAARIGAYLATVGHPVRLSLALTDHATGVTATYRPDQVFQTASVVKLDVLAALLMHAQESHRELSPTEHDLARQMIAVSDNNATTALWETVGGAPQIVAVNRRCGLSGTLTDPAGWGLTRTTASDQARLMDALVDGAGPIAPAGVSQARELLGNVANDQYWGISAAARPGEVTLLKNGWDRRDSDGGRWIVNSVGSIRATAGSLTLVVLSDGHPSPGAGIDVVQHVAQLAREQLDSSAPHP